MFQEKNKIEEEKKRSEASKVYLAWKNEKIRLLQVYTYTHKHEVFSRLENN